MPKSQSYNLFIQTMFSIVTLPEDGFQWLSTGIILSQTETDHKQWAFPHRYAYFKLPKVYSFYTALAFYLEGLEITGLLY